MNNQIIFEEPQTQYEATIPDDIFPVPCGERNYTTAAEKIFPIVARENIWFMRDGVVHEIADGEDGHELKPLDEERAVSVLEEVAKKQGFRIARFEGTKNKTTGKWEQRWRGMTMPLVSMKILLKTTSAKAHLPRIRNVVSCPILIQDGLGFKVLEQGYHDFNGGTYVTSAVKLPDVSIERAIAELLHLHEDFLFCTPSDMSRAIAVMFSMALRMGCFIPDDFPIHIAEAADPQSGKNFLQKCHAAIYNERPTSIVPASGSIGSLDEKLSQEMIKGHPFICLSNMRGAIKSGLLEDSIRGMDSVLCRTAYSRNVRVNTSGFIWQMSTNGAELTRDLAARSIITRIRKQPPGYPFKVYEEGDLLAHIRAQQPFYLACVFEVIKFWCKAEKPRTDDARHDFRRWTQSLDWIMQKFFALPSLLEGHSEQQERTGNPAMQWLRDLAHAVAAQKLTGKPLPATQIVEVCDEAGLSMPGRQDSKGGPHMRVGQIMANLFRSRVETAGATEIPVDGFTVRRVIRGQYDSEKQKQTEIKEYTFYPSGASTGA